MTRTNSRWRSGWLGLGAAVGALMAAGCAEIKPTPPRGPVEHVFTITLNDSGCPTAAEAKDKNCPGAPKACVLALNGDTVKFDAPKGIRVQFGPFKDAIFKPGQPLRVEVYVEKGLVAGKRFPFNVLGEDPADPNCKGVDPEIIVRP